MKKSIPKIPHICILLDMSLSACREKLRGILRYERLFGPWKLHLPTFDDHPYARMSFTEYDGIIADCVPGRFPGEPLKKCRHPIVLLDYLEDIEPSFHRFAHVRCDGNRIGKMGLEHFMKCGLSHFGFVDEMFNVNWSLNRRNGFLSRWKELSPELSDCFIYSEDILCKKYPKTESRRLVKWLRELPKPIGVFCAHDARAQQVIQACHKAEIAIPKEVTVLGVDDDEYLCQICDPTLSSIRNDNEEGGYLAAEVLAEMMAVPGCKGGTRFYPPLYVHTRQSTAIQHHIESFLQDAIQFVEAHAGIGIQVSDVVRVANVSRRLLEQHFRKVLRRSIHEVILDARFRRVCILLLETDLNINELARLCGFQSEYYICTAFKKRFGKTIFQYRKDRG